MILTQKEVSDKVEPSYVRISQQNVDSVVMALRMQIMRLLHLLSVSW